MPTTFCRIRSAEQTILFIISWPATSPAWMDESPGESPVKIDTAVWKISWTNRQKNFIISFGYLYRVFIHHKLLFWRYKQIIQLCYLYRLTITYRQSNYYIATSVSISDKFQMWSLDCNTIEAVKLARGGITPSRSEEKSCKVLQTECGIV